ncbi:baeRF6 domain-containing protein [Enterococcus olivae]
MAKIGKELFEQLTSEGVTGPFLTIMLNTHVAHQDIEKDQLKFKNFAKEAKQRFVKRYPELDWSPFQTKIDGLLSDRDFWRSGTTSAAIILTKEESYIHRLSIEVDDQYYVGDTPYLLAIIKNAQYNYHYYLLGLNRNSMKLYVMENKKLAEVPLPKDAPLDIKTAIGEEITGGNLNFRSQGSANGGRDSVAYHGVSAKDEEVEVDWVNYYQAVDSFFKDDFENEEGLPIYLFALPENQTMFKKVAKNPYYDATVAVSASPAQLSLNDLEKGAEQINEELTKKEVSVYHQLVERKNFDQLSDIRQAAPLGRIAQLFIATSNLIDGFGENPEVEYDWRQVLNTLADDTISNSGEVFILDEKDAPGEKELFAVLRY